MLQASPQYPVSALWKGAGDPRCARHQPLYSQLGHGQGTSKCGPGTRHQGNPGTSGNVASHSWNNKANRPDLTTTSPDGSSLIIVEVSCPFEGLPINCTGGRSLRKVDKYEPLRQVMLQRYASVEVLPFIVGSLGSWYPPNDTALSRLHIGWRYARLMRRLCVMSAIAGSQSIWYKTMCE